MDKVTVYRAGPIRVFRPQGRMKVSGVYFTTDARKWDFWAMEHELDWAAYAIPADTEVYVSRDGNPTCTKVRVMKASESVEYLKEGLSFETNHSIRYREIKGEVVSLPAVLPEIIVPAYSIDKIAKVDAPVFFSDPQAEDDAWDNRVIQTIYRGRAN